MSLSSSFSKISSSNIICLYHLAWLKGIPFLHDRGLHEEYSMYWWFFAEVFKVPSLYLLMSTSRNVAFSVEYWYVNFIDGYALFRYFMKSSSFSSEYSHIKKMSSKNLSKMRVWWWYWFSLPQIYPWTGMLNLAPFFVPIAQPINRR